jgi:hypothetical protein
MINVGSATNSHPARTLVMGVVNVTPNSFSDGGMWADPEVAIRHARDLVVEGADIIDVGGESRQEPPSSTTSLGARLNRKSLMSLPTLASITFSCTGAVNPPLCRTLSTMTTW